MLKDIVRVVFMKKKFASSALCLLTAIIWGSAFSAQEIASRYSDMIDAFFFNGIRFFVGSVALIPVILLFEREKFDKNKFCKTVIYGMITGCFLFAASAFQQLGIQMTGESGKAGFISGMYLIFVPIVSFIFFRQKISHFVWCGMVFSFAGLYFLCVGGNGISSIQMGDVLLLISAFFYTGHIIVIDKFIKKVSPLKCSSVQFMTVALLNTAFGLMFGHVSWEGITLTLFPILYCGIMSTGIGYTCQMIGQKFTPPAVAALLFSTEGVFSVIAECIVKRRLPETVTIIGCALMFAGIIFSQLPPIRKKNNGQTE